MDWAKDTELPGNVVAQFYRKPAMDTLIAKINATPEMEGDFKAAHLDTIATDYALLQTLARIGDTERTPFTDSQGSTFLIIASDKNASPTWERGNNDFGFRVKKIDPADIWLFTEMELWKYHAGEYAPEKSFDSIRKDEVKELKSILETEKGEFNRAKYLVTVCDIGLRMPQVHENNMFDGGLLLTEVKVYDRATGARVGRAVLMCKNTDEIPDTSSAVVKEGKQMVLLDDLLRSRNIKVMDFLQNKKDDKDPDNSQLKKTFTGGRDYYNNR
ncbi:hypothetical protein ACLI09_10705 [Flavobacterium sp. RHBU_24]|uniref:hypothetical protein n=1 Tax=Flavobacterium sp. RHBU_24 TaxID=3391185 RepID=UPI00398568BE